MNNTNSERLFRYALCGLAPILGIIIIREIPIGYVAADYYYYQRTFYDFFQQGGTWGEMHFGAAPGLFTNLLPVWIESRFLEDLTRLFLFHISLYGMITGGVIWLIARRLTGDSVAAVFAMILSILLIIVIGGENSFWNRPSHHYGSVINLLICLLLLLHGPGRWWVIAGVWAVVIMTVVSDFLFIPMYCGLVAGILLVAWASGREPFRRVLRIGVLLALPVAIGVGLYYLILPNASANPVWASGLSLRDVLSSPATHLAAMKFLAQESVRLPVYLAAPAVAVPALLSLSEDRERRNAFIAILVGFQIVVWGNIYMSGLGYPEVARYRLFAVNLSCILLALGVTILMVRQGGPALLRWAAFAMLLALGAGYLFNPVEGRIRFMKSMDRVYFDYVDEVRCIREAAEDKGLTAGIAAYKDASPYTMLTDGEIFLYPVDGRSLKPANYLVSRVGLKRPYNFALVSTDLSRYNFEDRTTYYPLSRGVVEKAYGPPREVHHCGEKMLMIYDAIDFGATAR